MKIILNDMNLVHSIKFAAGNLQNYSFPEFQKKLLTRIKQNVNYNFLNDLFRKEVGLSIEEYFNWKKVRKANELLKHYRLSVTETAYQLGYNNSSELMNQLANVPVIERRRKKQKQEV